MSDEGRVLFFPVAIAARPTVTGVRPCRSICETNHVHPNFDGLVIAANQAVRIEFSFPGLSGLEILDRIHEKEGVRLVLGVGYGRPKLGDGDFAPRRVSHFDSEAVRLDISQPGVAPDLIDADRATGRRAQRSFC